MALLTILLWASNMLVDTGGQLSFKAAASYKIAGKASGDASGDVSGLQHWKNMAVRPWLWIGICCYIAEFFVWMAFLSQVELSSGIMLGCINIVAIMLAGRLLFNDRLTPWRVTGLLLITCGVAVIGLGG
jgi:multidrug transporter EmrE-like cation transporter